MVTIVRLPLFGSCANVAYMVNESKPTFTDAEVLMALRKRIKGMSVRQAGATFGVSGAYIHDVLHKRRGISEKIGNALGFELIPRPARTWRTVDLLTKSVQKGS